MIKPNSCFCHGRLLEPVLSTCAAETTKYGLILGLWTSFFSCHFLFFFTLTSVFKWLIQFFSEIFFKYLFILFNFLIFVSYFFVYFNSVLYIQHTGVAL